LYVHYGKMNKDKVEVKYENRLEHIDWKGLDLKARPERFGLKGRCTRGKRY